MCLQGFLVEMPVGVDAPHHMICVNSSSRTAASTRAAELHMAVISALHHMGAQPQQQSEVCEGGLIDLWTFLWA